MVLEGIGHHGIDLHFAVRGATASTCTLHHGIDLHFTPRHSPALYATASTCTLHHGIDLHFTPRHRPALCGARRWAIVM